MLGRKLGFPTINQIIEEKMCYPKFGVYLSKIEVENNIYQGISYIGTKPTIENNNNIVIETHIFDFNQNLYGQKIKVYPISFLRDEIKFDSIEDLKREVLENIDYVKRLNKT